MNEEAVLACARTAGVAVDWTRCHGPPAKAQELNRCARLLGAR